MFGGVTAIRLANRHVNVCKKNHSVILSNTFQASIFLQYKVYM